MIDNQSSDFTWLPVGFHGQTSKDSLTGNILKTYRHVSGLVIKMLPRPGFSKRFAAITVPYGSIHTTFMDDKTTWQVPAGTAHYLEHCVFSRDDQGGLLGRLSELGAAANAYTTYTHTLYYFTAVKGFAEALDLYLDAVLGTYLETDRVEAERPVILAELDQYMDDPDTRAYMNLVESLYAVHPVRHDIGGTAETVQQITSQHLKRVWANFYQPGMLTLTLAGDLNEKAILEQLAGRLTALPVIREQPHFVLPNEPVQPARKYSQLNMDVSAPSFLVGIKDPGPCRQTQLGYDLIVRQRSARLALDCLLSPVSELREKLYSQGLINDAFDYHYTCEPSFSYVVCGGESARPDEAAAAVRDALIEAVRQGLPKELFEVQKRAAAGDFVSSLDSIEHSGMVQARCNLYQVDLFDYPPIYDKIKFSEAVDLIQFLADPDNYSITVLQPLEG